ncbi:hypothetical protein HK22_06160 [Gluconobacter sp. DsW_056]|nr:hypothetical protein HK22_06160 [Gluconobacter sp. DsW_056]
MESQSSSQNQGFFEPSTSLIAQIIKSRQNRNPRTPFMQQSRITRATMRIGLANIVYNMRRLLFLERIN